MKFVTWRDMEDGGDENGPNDSDALPVVSFYFSFVIYSYHYCLKETVTITNVAPTQRMARD